MNTNWTTADKIAQVIASTGCDATEAREYLIAEEGLVDEAVVSLLGDRELVKIGIRYEGSSFVDAKWVCRGALALYDIGSSWASADGSTRYTVVSH